MHVKLARAGPPRYVHRMVVVHGHSQDSADIVQIAFCHNAATCCDKRLERNDERTLFQVEELGSDRFVY
jgi:hypothetical protein